MAKNTIRRRTLSCQRDAFSLSSDPLEVGICFLCAFGAFA
jgi:hypothetical protein